MDGFLRALFALIAALNAATGAPVDVGNMPDRPPIVAPTMERIPHTRPVATSAPAEPLATTTITGTITSMKNGLVVVNGTSITLGPSTQVTGQLKTGAPVNVVAKVQPNGTLEAETLVVGQDAAVVATTTPTGQPSASPITTQTPGTTTTPKPGINLTQTPYPQPTGQAQASPTVNPTIPPTGQPPATPTANPQIQPTAQPQASPTANQVQPTGQPQANPTEKPQVTPTQKPSQTYTTGSTPTPTPNGGTGN